MKCTQKYSWIATSDDGSFEEEGEWFRTEESAYRDMRNHALAKMRWNTEYEDMDDGGSIGYEAHFSKNEIVHTSYSGTYTYRIISKLHSFEKYGQEWEIIESFTPVEGEDWKVLTIDGIGELWMNNGDGFMVLIEPDGRIIQCYY